ncbi:MAG TPA: serine/threonine-protein kinase, partial [Rudaea sp.]|nr:serine/threonine-protein kinase [Rudaea sp.]
ARWLDENCGDDAALRAELERLLRADAKAAQFMETPPPLIAQAVAATSAAAELPQAFGVWRVLRSLGEGGMGTVWLAERSDGEFEQRVAIKQLAWPTPGLLQRFRQERQILARLEHPNIAHLIDGGVDASGAPYLVMEYVEGQPITEYVRTRALDLRARLDLFQRVCDGVQYAHQNLIVHRDLKPSNIFVTDDGLPKLLDFGIAKVLATTDEAAQTQTAARMLTPDYAAPEQFSGGAITTATDVYALGVVLYELLADVRPRRAQAGPTHAMTEPLPPSAAIDRTTGNANTRRRALRGDLDRIALKALAAEPQQRYSSAEALASDIRRYLDGRPIMARGDSAWYRFRKYARRNRYALAAAIIAFAVCLAATFVSLHQANVARDEAARARIEASKSKQVAEFVSQILSSIDPDRAQAMDRSLIRSLLDSAAKNVGRELGTQPAVYSSIEETIASSYSSIGEYALADTHLLSALAASHALVDYAAAQPRLIAKRSGVLENLGRYKEAHALAQQAVTLAAVLPEDDRTRLVAEARLASSDCVLFRHQACRERFARVYAVERRAFGETDPDTLYALSGLANASVGPGSYAQAKMLIQELLKQDRLHFGEDNSRTLKAVKMLALVENNLGEHTEAENLLRSNLPIAERVLGERHPTTAEMVLWLGESLRLQKRYAEARPLLERALALLTKIYGSHHFMTISAQSALMALLTDTGDYPAAEYQARALLATMKALPGGQGYIGSFRSQLAKILVHEKRFAEAERELDEASAEKKEISPNSAYEPTDLIKDHMALYAAWGKPHLVELWRAKLSSGTSDEHKQGEAVSH